MRASSAGDHSAATCLTPTPLGDDDPEGDSPTRPFLPLRPPGRASRLSGGEPR